MHRGLDASNASEYLSDDGSVVFDRQAGQQPESGSQITCRWVFPAQPLKAGWYMLEVNHSSTTVGSCLTLSLPGGRQEYLRLGSKQPAKRVLWLGDSVADLAVELTASQPLIEQIALVGLTQRFAESRMRQRLVNRLGNLPASRLYGRSLYQEYAKHLNAVFSVRATTEAVNVDSGYGIDATLEARCSRSLQKFGGEPNAEATKSVRLQIVVGAKAEQGVPESLANAVLFAQKLGYEIFCECDGPEEHVPVPSASCSEFILLADSTVCYAASCLADLLAAITDETKLVYADHDYIGLQGERESPALKPQWNPELLLNTNYIKAPWIVEKQWVDTWFHLSLSDLDEASLLLRAAFAMDRASVIHVPWVLASLHARSDEPEQNWLPAVKEEVALHSPAATVVDGLLPGSARIFWPLPTTVPSVDIIVPTRDCVDVLRKCIESILSKTAYSNYRVHIVDNDSKCPETKAYYERLGSDSRIELTQYNGAFNYSAINNQCVRATRGDIVLLLNNDTEVIDGNWLDEMVRQVSRADVGCVGAKLYYTNGAIQHGGVITGITGIAGHAHRYEAGDSDGYCGRLKQSQYLTAVTAACLAVRRDVWEQAGGLDEVDLAVAWNDVDFCLRVQSLGYHNLWTPYAQLFHHEGFSRGSDNTRRKVMRARREFSVMQARWQLQDTVDPAYHPQLTREFENFQPVSRHSSR